MLRPFANVEGLYYPPETPEEGGKQMWNRFKYCLVDWEGFIDCSCEDDAEEECKCPAMEVNEDNKLILYNLLDDLVIFVVHKDVDMRKEVSEQLKN